MKKAVVVLAVVAAAAGAIAGGAKGMAATPPAETVGAARIDAKTGDKTRDPGWLGSPQAHAGRSPSFRRGLRHLDAGPLAKSGQIEESGTWHMLIERRMGDCPHRFW